MASSSNSYNSPCAACKFLRRKCMPGCIFAPYFPPEEPHKFANVHKIFGASNVTKLLNELLPHQREDAVNSLAYEAEARVRDPVYGCVGAISYLQRQVHRLQKELDAANADLAHYGLSTSAAGTPGNVVDLVFQPQPLPPQQPPPLNPVYRLSGANPVMSQMPRSTGGSYGTFLPWNNGHDQQGNMWDFINYVYSFSHLSLYLCVWYEYDIICLMHGLCVGYYFLANYKCINCSYLFMMRYIYIYIYIMFFILIRLRFTWPKVGYRNVFMFNLRVWNLNESFRLTTNYKITFEQNIQDNCFIVIYLLRGWLFT